MVPPLISSKNTYPVPASRPVNSKTPHVRPFSFWLQLIVIFAVFASLVWLIRIQFTLRELSALIKDNHNPISSASPEIVQQMDVLSLKQATVEGKLDALIAILAVGFGFSILLVVYSEYRSYNADKASEERTTKAFNLSFHGESASQKRAEDTHLKFLEGSQKTLSLVNETLKLAKEASERAANMMTEKMRASLLKLENDCKIQVVKLTQNDRALVESPEQLSILQKLSQEINAFETINSLLPQELPLGCNCTFIRGMSLHVHQYWDSAILSWEAAAIHPDAEGSLKSLAWYWIGYERNNLGKFAEASNSFDNALATASGLREFELRRIQIETRFFQDSKQAFYEEIISDLEGLLIDVGKASGADEEKSLRVRKIGVTLANVLMQFRKKLELEGNEEDSNIHLERAKELLEMAEEQGDKWARFGLAELLQEKFPEDSRLPKLWEDVKDDMEIELLTRPEQRTKVLAKSTDLICCINDSKRLDEFVSNKSALISLVADVGIGLTVYSQVRRKNVDKRLFLKEDLRALEEQYQNKKDSIQSNGGPTRAV